MICGPAPFAPFTSRKPSAPAPPDLFTTTIDCFIRLCLATMPWMARAIWSAPPPVPAGTMNSTVFVGSQACAAMGAATVKAAAARYVSLRFIRILLRSYRNNAPVPYWWTLRLSCVLILLGRLGRRLRLARCKPFPERDDQDHPDRPADVFE